MKCAHRLDVGAFVGTDGCLFCELARLTLENADLKEQIAELRAELHPCAFGCFREATHAKVDVIFGVNRAELCAECARQEEKDSGVRWVRKAQVPE